jgi:hypothetical protein
VGFSTPKRSFIFILESLATFLLTLFSQRLSSKTLFGELFCLFCSSHGRFLFEIQIAKGENVSERPHSAHEFWIECCVLGVDFRCSCSGSARHCGRDCVQRIRRNARRQGPSTIVWDKEESVQKGHLELLRIDV